MAKKYTVGDRYYLPVIVNSILDEGCNYPVGIEFVDSDILNTTEENAIADEPDLLLTATEIAENVAGRRCTECSPMYDELKSRNAELEALLKEVMATRDEAIRQNDELLAENSKLKSDCNDWKETANERLNAVQTLSAERNKVMAELDQRKNDVLAMKEDRDNLLAENEKWKAESERLNAYYMEANRTATEAAEANDDLKAKIADLRNRVGEQLAQIQDLNAEVHFLKEKGGKQTEEATKHAHVVLNDGTELAFTQKDTIAFYRDDVDMLFISDGDGVIAGFNRGDKPTNFAYFY